MKLTALLEKKSGSNVSEATVQLLKRLQVPVTATTAIEKVENHPDFPSLYSISDSLKSWKVENAAFHIEAEDLDKVPTPFIAHTRRGGGNFVLVENVNGSVDFINERGRKEVISRETFLKEWTNAVLLAEKNDGSGEKNYRVHKKKEIFAGLRIPLIVATGLALVTIYAILNSNSTVGVTNTLLLATKLFGCIITGLLLWFEVDKANPVLQQICTGSKNTNCTAVLNSKSAKLFNWLSWSEVGFFYFAGSFLSLLFSSTSTFSLLYWLNLFALPYTIFSIYYQWRIAKQWCPLCLTVQALLMTEFIIGYFGYWTALTNQSLSYSTVQLLPIFSSFLLPILFWLAAKKAYLTAQAGKQYKKELNKLKYNKEIFTALLQKQKAITASTEGLGICLGNPNAKHTVIKVCNPFCGPCAKAHKVIDELIESGEVKVQIIFMIADDENDRAKTVKHLMALYEKNNAERMLGVLDDWYNAEKKDYNAFAAKYSLGDELQNQGNKLTAMKNWCDKTGVTFTPTIFIDGYQLPEVYKVEDLNHLL